MMPEINSIKRAIIIFLVFQSGRVEARLARQFHKKEGALWKSQVDQP